jgi:UDP-GlcNAc:undecaprenyl-phosphate/decaprenyl-phosphate GlcNAc-1-phosphate transferase
VTAALLQYGLAFAGTLLLLRLLARLALRVGLVDTPGRRKRHRGAIPLIGGPAIFAGLAFGALFIVDTLYPYRALFAGLAVLLIAGLLDDLRDLSPRQKFAAQLLAGAIVIFAGHTTVFHLGDLFGFGPVSLPNWGVPFTIVALLGMINAINMADGADGLASGLALVALLFLALCALLSGLPVSFQLLMTAFAAVAAFWAMNMRFPWQPHAKVFLGDSGSMMLGLLLTWFSIEVARGGLRPPPIAAVWFLALPLIDMAVVILRRLGRGHSPFRAGRDHFHHMLIAAGLRPGTAVLLILAIALALASVGFFAWRARLPESWLFYGFLALLAFAYLLSGQWLRIVRRLRRRKRRWAAAASSNRITAS